MAFSDLAEDDPLRRMLMTPREGHLFDDGIVFTAPRALQGVPVDRITEDHDYWQASWKSLDQYIAGEQQQEDLKERYRVLEASITGATSQAEMKRIKEKHKLHSDNVSKQRKIREVFGPSTAYHPNQIVAKEYLPSEGLCEQELVYILACKISDLTVLSNKGELAMDPFDFIRWRISEKMLEKDIWKRDAKHNPIRSLVARLGADATGNNKYHDALFRRAIMRSAMHQGNLKRYGSKKKAAQAQSANSSDASLSETITSRRRRRRPRTETEESEQDAVSMTAEAKAARRRERIRALQERSQTGYNGTARRDGSGI